MVEGTRKTETKTFLHNIAWLRRQHGLSQKRMAQMLGIGVASLRKIEKGEMPDRLGASAIYAVYKHFGIPPSQLFDHWMGE